VSNGTAGGSQFSCSTNICAGAAMAAPPVFEAIPALHAFVIDWQRAPRGHHRGRQQAYCRWRTAIAAEQSL